jgi:hypothetical protein
VSEQQEELGEADAKLEVDEQAAGEEEAAEGEALVVDTADETAVEIIDEDHEPVDAEDLASLEESVAVAEPEVDEPAAPEGEPAEDEPAEDQAAEAPASDYVVITTPPPAAPQQGSRLGRLLRRRRS